ncbi:MAG: hypothetical protein PWP76_503 [Candidatus Diapherotrites archaeon]|nr:hypothetical protein [Candidatus Diapherotrites archaeon]MDN5367033.1 hypothetical protein [Candidatus Diapherotrites archaeon]
MIATGIKWNRENLFNYPKHFWNMAVKKIHIVDVPPVPDGITSADVLATFIAQSLDLIPKKGKPDVVIKLIQIFSKIAGKREDTVVIGNRQIAIKNGAIKVDDLYHWLQSEGVSLGLSQLYTTYLSRFLDSGLIVKKKGSMYGLRADRLEDVFSEIERDVSSLLAKIRNHAARLDRIVKE